MISLNLCQMLKVPKKTQNETRLQDPNFGYFHMEILFSCDSLQNHTMPPPFNCNLSFQEAKRSKINNLSFSSTGLFACTALHFHWQGRTGDEGVRKPFWEVLGQMKRHYITSDSPIHSGVITRQPRSSHANWTVAYCQLLLTWPTIPWLPATLSLYHTLFFVIWLGSEIIFKNSLKCYLTSYHELKV